MVRHAWGFGSAIGGMGAVCDTGRDLAIPAYARGLMLLWAIGTAGQLRHVDCSALKCYSYQRQATETMLHDQ